MSRPTKSCFLTRFRVTGHTLVIDLGRPQRVLSSAPRRGGLARARYILNHQVRANPLSARVLPGQVMCDDPARALTRVAADVGADACCVGLMTAVSLEELVVMREEEDGLWVEAFLTVGVSNAVRAGEGSHVSRAGNPGTINIILVTNARLAASAMVCAVQVATEAKTAALLTANVRTCAGRPGATGTGTDATVIACGNGPFLRYSGTHTRIGVMIGRLVGQGVRDGLRRGPDSLIPN